MATIEMDISEYKLMEENKLLLEKAIEEKGKLILKIEELNEEKRKLNEEKIKAYEEAQYTVSQITTIENREVLIYYREDFDELSQEKLDEYQRFVRKFISTCNGRGYGNGYVEKQALIELVREIQSKAEKTVKITKSTNVTSKGLDIVREEIRVELDELLSKDVQNKLKSREIIMDNLYKKELEFDNLIVEQKNLSKEKDSIIKERDDAWAELKELKPEFAVQKMIADKYKDFYSKVKEIVFSTKFFYKRASFNDIKELVKNTK